MNLREIKKLKITFFITSLLLLASCGWWASKIDIEDAKKDLLWDNYNASQNNTEDNSDTSNNKIDDNKSNLTAPEIPERKEFVTIDNIWGVDAYTQEVKITWNVETSVDKIVVKFSNSTSDFPDDEFQLTKFKPGDKTFEYNAYKRFQVLDTGENNYEIIAYKWEQKASSFITITIPEKQESISELDTDNENTSTTTSEWFWTEDDYLAIDLPENENIWNVLKLSNTNFTYSKIDDFEVKKLDKPLDLSCTSDEVTNYLINNYGWTYWNTCRPFDNSDDSKWVSFFVLRLSGDKYFYEKHYYDKKHGLYGIKTLETGEWIDKNNIWEKNKEFKTKDFDNDIEWSDEVFKIITK